MTTDDGELIPYAEHLRRVRQIVEDATADALLADALLHTPRLREYIENLHRMLADVERDADQP